MHVTPLLNLFRSIKRAAITLDLYSIVGLVPYTRLVRVNDSTSLCYEPVNRRWPVTTFAFVESNFSGDQFDLYSLLNTNRTVCPCAGARYPCVEWPIELFLLPVILRHVEVAEYAMKMEDHSLTHTSMNHLVSSVSDRLKISNETWSMGSCTSNHTPREHATSLESIAMRILAMHVSSSWRSVFCDPPHSPQDPPSLLQAQLDEYKNQLSPSTKSCYSKLLDQMLRSEGTLGIDHCMVPNTPLSFSPVLAGASLDSHGLISIPVFTSRTLSSSPTASPHTCTGTIVCEEIPVESCSGYSGCFTSWGPCQTVTDGFWSPPGRMDQVPCPAVSPDQEFLPSSGSRYCLFRCKDERSVVDLVTKNCAQLSPGQYVADRLCEPNMVSECAAQEGFIFVSRGSCDRRILTPALGPVMILGNAVTIQSWVKMSTATLSASSPGLHTAWLGVFGELCFGYVTTSDGYVRLFASRGSHTYSTSEVVRGWENTFWNHVGAVVDELTQMVRFYLNGTSVGEDKLSRSSSAITLAVFTRDVASQITPYLNRLHYGSFVLEKVDLTDPDSLRWHTVIPPVSVAFQLFNPNVSEGIFDMRTLGVFGPFPGSSAPQNASRHFCLTGARFCAQQSEKCFEECLPGAVFNPFTCLCDAIQTTTTFVPTTIAQKAQESTTMLTSSSTSPPAGTPGYITPLVVVLVVLTLASGVFVYIRRMRKKPHTKWVDHTVIDPFSNITFDEGDFNHNLYSL
jgi:hypothetical protein